MNSKTTSTVSWLNAYQSLPLVAILRGVSPDNITDTTSILVSAGFRLIEVPLNSPQPLDSIERMSREHGSQALIGAGTVLDTESVQRVADAGGRMIVAPTLNMAVGESALKNDMIWIPGVATPTEAFTAINAGATALKIFPAEQITPAVLKAWCAILPDAFDLLPVGGITVERMRDYWQVGATGFGLGSSLYSPDIGLTQLEERATAFVGEMNALRKRTQ